MRNRTTIRKGVKPYKHTELFLYGSRKNRCIAKGYCELHKCYLDGRNIRQKKCKIKKCKYFEIR